MNNLKLTLLGTGTPWPSVERQATANLVEAGASTLLFDVGRGASTQLAKLGRHPRDVDYIFLTHHHFDHIAGLGDLLLSAWNDGRIATVRVIGPQGTIAIIDHLLGGIYQRDIMFRLKEAKAFGFEMPDIRDVVCVQELDQGQTYQGPDWQVTAHRVEHGHAMGLSHQEWPCFGYRLEYAQKILAISGDTIDCPGVRMLAHNADLLLQCCYMAEAEIDTKLKRLLADQVLASARAAGRIANAAMAKRLVLTHLAPKSPAMLQTTLEEAQSAFSGEAILGQDLATFTL